MTGVLVEGELGQTHLQGEGPVKMKAEVRVVVYKPRGQNCQELQGTGTESVSKPQRTQPWTRGW